MDKHLDRALDLFWIKSLNGTFLVLQIKAFRPKNFKFHAEVKKCHFGNFSFLAKWHFWTCAWNSKFFLAKSILLKDYENKNKKKFHNLPQGPPNLGFMQEKVQKGDFPKKPFRELKNYFCFRFLRTLGKLN